MNKSTWFSYLNSIIFPKTGLEIPPKSTTIQLFYWQETQGERTHHQHLSTWHSSLLGTLIAPNCSSSLMNWTVISMHCQSPLSHKLHVDDSMIRFGGGSGLRGHCPLGNEPQSGQPLTHSHPHPWTSANCCDPYRHHCHDYNKLKIRVPVYKKQIPIVKLSTHIHLV